MSPTSPENKKSNLLLQGNQVPFARDGSCFHLGLKRNGTYTVGEKTAERHYENFEDALCHLRQMTVAAWRRPNPKGNWGVVASIRWGDLPEDMVGVPPKLVQSKHEMKGNCMAKDFYKDKGMTRYTLILPQAHKDKIEAIAKSHKISQGAVMEVLLDHMDLNALDQFFETKNKVKRVNKSSKRQIIENMKDLNPEQLAEVNSQIAKIKATFATPAK
jgi:hypothetical protein